jgi:hypothetical protein
MNEPRADFKRMLLRLPQSTHDYAAVGAAAQLAGLLGASVVATFVQDADLVDVAALPCVRELRPLGGGWHPIEGPQLVRQLDRAAATAQRLFQDAVRAIRIEASFNVARGPVEDMMASAAAADDIIVIIEPRNPAERVTQQFSRLVDAAFRASIAVMVVPSRIVRTAGPIAAVISGPDDPSIRTAVAIAAAAKERVIALGPSGSNACESIAELADAAGVRVEAGPDMQEPLDVSTLLTQLSRLNDRLLVMSRGALGDRRVPTLASLRGTPILLARAANR